MKKKNLNLVYILVIAILFFSSQSGLAQTYLFQVAREVVDVYWNDTGTLTVAYQFDIINSPSGDAFDVADIGAPTSDYDISKATASINGIPLTGIQKSPYVKNGIAVELGQYAIPPGGSGTLQVVIPEIKNVLYVDSQDSNYASAVFSPSWFGSEFVQGATDLTVTYHLPSGIQPEEPRWHAAPSGFSEQPTTGFDQNGHIIYTWTNPQASAATEYKFGASFPKNYIPESAIVAQSIDIGKIVNFIFSLLCFIIPIAFVGFIIYTVIIANRRKSQYLPPKIALEGHGIKRGLTAVEAAILMEQPLDKILTMVLFSLIKKGAVKVTSKDPFAIETIEPLSENLRPYELDFIKAFQKTDKKERQEALQECVIGIVRSLQEKMRGFSRKETIDYYKNIVETAWQQVEQADTPEVKSQKFDENLEWTMLDKDYDDHTRTVFRQGPVFVPTWWSHYDPAYPRTSSNVPSVSPSNAPAQISLPRLPGSDFAASMVNGVQNFSASVIGNIEAFTGKVTSKTNPVPVSTSSRSSSHTSGGCACACACACAGCACACAGGGR